MRNIIINEFNGVDIGIGIGTNLNGAWANSQNDGW